MNSIDNIKEYLTFEILENSLIRIIWFACILLAGVIFKRLITRLSSRIIYKMFRKYSEEVSAEKLFELVRKPFGMFIILIFAYVAFNQLEYPSFWHLAPKQKFGLQMVVERLYLVFFLSTIIWIFLRIVDFVGIILIKRAEKTESKQDDQIVPFLIEGMKVVVVILGIFIILGSVFKLNIGSLIAGLGIGGLAVALAAKETLENLFGSFTIFLDKPFTIGDQVTVGNITGVVEKIGFRSTRIRTLEKSFLTVPNKKMVDSELDNLTLRTSIRAKSNLSLNINTSPAKINAVRDDILELLQTHPHTKEDPVVRFADFSSHSVDLLILYFVDTSDWNFYIEIREEINLKILEIVHKNEAGFAVPVTSVILQK